MNKCCQNCGFEYPRKIKNHVFHCGRCDAVVSTRTYEYKEDFFNDFFIDGFVSGRNMIFEEFFKEDIIRNVSHEKLDVLDVGCATGDFIGLCDQKTEWNLTGIDISADAIGVARSRYRESKFYAATLADHIKNNKNMRYDIVFCCHTLEHIQNPQHFVYLIMSAIKPGGILYIDLPNERTDPFFWLERRFSRNKAIENYNNHKYGHVNFFNKKSLEILLKDFKILKFRSRKYPSMNDRKKAFFVKSGFKKYFFKTLEFFNMCGRFIIIAKK